MPKIAICNLNPNKLTPRCCGSGKRPPIVGRWGTYRLEGEGEGEGEKARRHVICSVTFGPWARLFTRGHEYRKSFSEWDGVGKKRSMGRKFFL